MVLVLRESMHFFTKMCVKNDLHISATSDLDQDLVN